MTESLPAGRRSSGVLLHPTSLPGGVIGDLGDSAFRFVDWLALAGQSYWQILPLGPVDASGSPYNSLSALAGNPLLISPELLGRDDLLDAASIRADAGTIGPVDYRDVRRLKEEMLRVAYRRFRATASSPLVAPFDEFRAANEGWLADYALFGALRDFHRGAPWCDWPEEVKRRRPEALERWRALLADEIEQFAFEQFLFDRQWRTLRSYAISRGIRIIGDLPIFVAYDSADVWADPSIFDLADDGSPLVVSGVPPDYFSATGQRWGNPLYRWSVLRDRDYDWWIDRFRRTLELVDVIRIDHFRGFAAYWEVQADEETAVHGRWVDGPGIAFFRALEKRLGSLPVIAEDLGLITPDVNRLRDALGYRGMRVLQFAFDGDPRNPHLPENYPMETVAYTGTHDNDTLRGWWSAAAPDQRRRVRKWLGTREPTSWTFTEAVFSSRAELAIVPLQDLLDLGAESRMNTPGAIGSNWTWRMDRLPPAEVAQRLRELSRRAGRNSGNG